MRQVHLGLAHLAGPHLERTLYRDTPPDGRLPRYGDAFGCFEAGCATDPNWTRSAAGALLERMPLHVRLLPRHPGAARHDAWAEANQDLLASRRCGPVHLPWNGPWTPRAEYDLDALLGRLWDILPSTGRVAVEFHDRSWFRTEAMRLLDEHHVGLVWSAAAGIIPYRAPSDFLYVRLSGTKVRPAGEDVAAFLQRVRARSNDPRPVYVVGARPEEFSLHALERFARGVGAPWTLEGATARPQARLDAFAVPA